MPLEVATFLSQLVASNPPGSDQKFQGDNHIRLMKAVLQATFPNASKAFYFPTSVAAKTLTYTVLPADAGKTIPMNAAGGALTVNLPASGSIWDGFEVAIVKTDAVPANLVTIDGDASDPINGALTITLWQQYQAILLRWCSAISGWVAWRAETAPTFDSTLVLTGLTSLGRAAISGAVSVPAGSNAATQTIDMVAVIGDGVNVIGTGVKGYLPFDFAATITQATLLADVSGSIVIDIWKDTYANYPPTVADTITAAAKPTLAAAQKSQDATLTGWTTAIAAGDVLGFNVDSAATVKQVTLALKLTKTG